MCRQRPTAGLTDVGRAFGARAPGCWGEHLRCSVPPRDERGYTVSWERRRLPRDALIAVSKWLDIGFRLFEKVPVRLRLRLGSIIPGGRFMGGARTHQPCTTLSSQHYMEGVLLRPLFLEPVRFGSVD